MADTGVGVGPGAEPMEPVPVGRVTMHPGYERESAEMFPGIGVSGIGVAGIAVLGATTVLVGCVITVRGVGVAVISVASPSDPEPHAAKNVKKMALTASKT